MLTEKVSSIGRIAPPPLGSVIVGGFGGAAGCCAPGFPSAAAPLSVVAIPAPFLAGPHLTEPLLESQRTAFPTLRELRRGEEAAGLGFEPGGRLHAQRFSRPPHSAALAPRRAGRSI